VIGRYQEPGWETVTALFLPETADSLFLQCVHLQGPFSLEGGKVPTGTAAMMVLVNVSITRTRLKTLYVT
jgi:hypothetical protein